MSDQAIVARMESNQLAGLLKTVAGVRGSETQVFSRKITITIHDLKDLNFKLSEKIARYRPLAEIFSGKANFEKGRSKEFDSFDQLVNYDWSRSELTETLSLKWSFMTHPVVGSQPEMHSICIRLSEAINPAQFLQLALSRSPDELEHAEFDPLSPMVCRVDYADDVLSKDFLREVEEWNKSRGATYSIIPMMEKLAKHEDALGKCLFYGLQFFTFLLYAILYYHYSESEVGSKNVGLWLIGLFAVNSAVGLFAGFVSDSLISLMRRTRKNQIFSLTNGDKIKITETMAKSTSATWKFLGGIVGTLVYKLVVLFFTFYWGSSGS